MTDRECLLIAYGALQILDKDGEACFSVKEHLFALKVEPQPIAVTREVPNIYRQVMFDEKPSPAAEEKSAIPGEYRLKRQALGTVGLELCNINRNKLIKRVAEYRAMTCPIHPEALKDIEAAELYLASITEAV